MQIQEKKLGVFTSLSLSLMPGTNSVHTGDTGEGCGNELVAEILSRNTRSCRERVLARWTSELSCPCPCKLYFICRIIFFLQHDIVETI